jgi:hypothetical protein
MICLRVGQLQNISPFKKDDYISDEPPTITHTFASSNQAGENGAPVSSPSARKQSQFSIAIQKGSKNNLTASKESKAGMVYVPICTLETGVSR